MELVKKELTEKMRLLALSSEIGTILSRGGPIAATLQLCCESLVRHLDAVFARIWLVNGEGQILELNASAGLYTNLDGKHSRIPMGKYKIGSIAKNKKPHLTNSVIGDPLVYDQEWAKREKLVSFVGHPLMVEGKVTGVMALFARYPLSDFVSKMLASLADGIAMGVERKKVEGALLAERDFNATLINTSPAFFGAISPSGQVMMLNQAMLKATGYTKEEVVGVDYLSTFVPSEEHEKLTAIFSEIAVLKKPTSNENQIISKDGRRYDVLWHGQPILKANGELDFFYGTGLDITERKKAAEVKEELKRQLLQSQKMEAIGTLAGGIAHDFNNILSAIYGYADLAYDDINKPENLRQDIDEILKGAERAKNLVRQILTFSRKTAQEKKPLQVSLVVKEALNLLRSSIPTTIDIQQDITSEALVLADPTQIHQIVMNLCTNAYQAMRESGGILGVSLKDLEISMSDEIPDLKLAAGRYLHLEISDTGVGMDEAIQANIFEPYYTTKGLGEGTGLGLAVVHGAVENHGGRITVDSESGQGATFHIYFPVYEGERNEILPEEQGTPISGGNEKIMVVDDDVTIIELAKKTLTGCGYEVGLFSNGVQAYQELQQYPDKYDLIITDMTMPYMTGADLAQKVLELCPDLPIILCSGHSELINREKALAIGIREYCDKPLHKKQMLRTVRKVLDNTKICGVRILFVDDAQFNVDLSKLLLEQLGGEVTVSISGQDAIEIFRNAPDDFDIVITDLRMPEMSGIELAERILLIRPDIPIVLVTGDEEALREDFLPPNMIREVLTKPIAEKSLVSAINRAVKQC